MLRVALIPQGVINHGEDKPSCMQSERYPIRGGLGEKQRLAQALLCIWRYSRTIYIIFGMQECCLLNHVYIHSFWSIIKATEKFPRGGGIWSPGMDLWWGIWTAFRPREGEFSKNFPKIQMPGGLPGGGESWSFDLTGALVLNGQNRNAIVNRLISRIIQRLGRL